MDELVFIVSFALLILLLHVVIEASTRIGIPRKSEPVINDIKDKSYEPFLGKSNVSAFTKRLIYLRPSGFG